MIHGLERRLRPPRLGSIGLGITVQPNEGKPYPREVEYFVVAEEIADVYGEKPTALPVRFPWPEPEQVLHSIDYVLRKGRSVVRRCDGMHATELRAAGADVSFPCKIDLTNPYARCPDGCRASARLSVVIPKTPLGIWEVRVGGIQRIADLLSQLRLYRAAVGPLTQLPFDLERVAQQEQYMTATGEVAWRTGYPIRVRCPYTVETVVALQEARGLPIALPPAPHEEDVVDAETDNGDVHAGGAEATAEPTGAGTNPGTERPSTSLGPAGVEFGYVTLHGPAGRSASAGAPLTDDWDISMAFAAARDLGLGPDEYTGYLAAVYGTDVDNLSPDALARQQAILTALRRQTPETRAITIEAMRRKGRTRR